MQADENQEITPMGAEKSSSRGSGEGWLVTLHNDEVNDLDSVMSAIKTVTGLDRDMVFELVVEAHNMGKVHIALVDKNRALTLKHALIERNLTVTTAHVG